MRVSKLLVAAILVVGSTNVIYGQSTPATQFEVASIKPGVESGPGPGGVRTFPGGRLTTQGTVLRSIIQFAFRLKPYQVVGGPDWINSERYDIDAKSADNASPELMLMMLQRLLEDRFKLKVKRETRDLPVFELVPVKDGVKLAPPQEGSCFVVDLSRPGRGAPPRNRGDAPPTPCGSVSMSAGPAGARLDGGQVSMSALIFTLSNMMGRPVVDKTGFTEKFDVHVSFTPDESLEGLPPRGARGGQPVPLGEDPSRGTIFSELQKQLGLKLESAKGPVELIVIDHVERPIPNGGSK